MNFRSTHFRHHFSRDGLVVDRAAAPRGLGLFLLPSVHTAQAAVIVVAQPLEVVERSHPEIETRQRARKFLANGIQNTNARLSLDALG